MPKVFSRPLHAWPFLLVLLIATPAIANMAEPPAPESIQAGSAAGELSGGLAGVRVMSEQLRVDLRPLAEGGAARVEATYRLRNGGSARELTLWFVAHALFSTRSEVELDGGRVASIVVPDTALPADWHVPAATPDPAGGEPLAYRSGSERVIGFRIQLAPGEHTVRVRYQATAAVFRTRGLMPVRQIGYVLSPARRWDGFGTLDVRVELPRGWNATASPVLRRDGDALVGQFQGIPAGALAISAQGPEPGSGWRYALVGLGALLGLWGLARSGRALGAALGMRGRGATWAFPVALLLATVLSVAVATAWVAVPAWMRLAAGPMANQYEISRMSYGAGFMLILIIPLVFLAGLLAFQIPAVRAARRTRGDGR